MRQDEVVFDGRPQPAYDILSQILAAGTPEPHALALVASLPSASFAKDRVDPPEGRRKRWRIWPAGATKPYYSKTPPPGYGEDDPTPPLRPGELHPVLESLVKGAEAGDKISYPSALAALDWLEEHGHGPAAQAVRRGSEAGFPVTFPSVAAGQIRSHFKALALHEHLRGIDPSSVRWSMDNGAMMSAAERSRRVRRFLAEAGVPFVGVATDRTGTGLGYAYTTLVLPRRADPGLGSLHSGDAGAWDKLQRVLGAAGFSSFRARYSLRAPATD